MGATLCLAIVEADRDRLSTPFAVGMSASEKVASWFRVSALAERSLMLHKRTDPGPAVWRRNGGAVPLHIPKERHYVFNSPHANGLGHLKTELERLSVLGST